MIESYFPLIDLTQAAKMLRCSNVQLQELADDHEINSLTKHRVHRFAIEDIVRYSESIRGSRPPEVFTED